MRVFRIIYFDRSKNCECPHDIEYDGLALSDRELWEHVLSIALKWCEENNSVLVGIVNISM